MKKTNSKSFLILMTGVLIGFAPLTTDTYLPCFPELTEFFSTSASMIQMSLMAAMIGIAIGPLLIGPLSDKHGRKVPLIISLGLFSLVTCACVLASNLYAFIALRFLQGLAASSGMVLSRAILTDSFSGRELSKTLSFNTAIFGFTPAAAPVLGGLLLLVTQWRGIFVFLVAIGVIVFIASFALQESLPSEKREQAKDEGLASGFAALMKNPTYLKYAAVFTLSFTITFAYIAASPFIFQTHYHLSPLAFSILYGMSTLASASGSLTAARFSDSFKALKVGTLGAFIAMLLTACLLIMGAPVAILQVVLCVLFFFNGITFPASTMLALEITRRHAGTASAVLGSASFVLGGIVSPLVGIGNVLYGASIAMLTCAFLSMLVCHFGFRKVESMSLVQQES